MFKTYSVIFSGKGYGTLLAGVKARTLKEAERKMEAWRVVLEYNNERLHKSRAGRFGTIWGRVYSYETANEAITQALKHYNKNICTK